MKYFAEKEAEEFLRKQGFNVVETYFCRNKNELIRASSKIGFPLVIKISGKKIVHKNRIKGVKVGVKDEKELVEEFNRLRKIKNFEGVLLQKKVFGREFILGLKDTDDFEHVIAFGVGGIDVEKMKNVVFRVLPLNKKEINDFVKEIGVKNSNENNLIKRNIMKLCELSEKFPAIRELDINPLIVNKDSAFVVDARIVFK